MLQIDEKWFRRALRSMDFGGVRRFSSCFEPRKPWIWMDFGPSSCFRAVLAMILDVLSVCEEVSRGFEPHPAAVKRAERHATDRFRCWRAS